MEKAKDVTVGKRKGKKKCYVSSCASGLLLTIALFFSGIAGAKPLIADLSLRTIEIDSGFTGTEILLFGARNDAGDVVVVIRGPKLSYVVRKKARMAGIWVNTEQVTFKGVEGFYNVAASRPLEGIKNDYLLSALGIGLEHLELVPVSSDADDKDPFTAAFIAKQHKDRLYLPTVGEVSFIGDTLFRTIINFPETIPRGTYSAEVYLFSDGQLRGVQSTPLLVHKKGFDAFIFDLAYNHSVVYGVAAILLALAGGWLAGLVFRRVT